MGKCGVQRNWFKGDKSVISYQSGIKVQTVV